MKSLLKVMEQMTGGAEILSHIWPEAGQSTFYKGEISGCA